MRLDLTNFAFGVYYVYIEVVGIIGVRKGLLYDCYIAKMGKQS